MASSVSTPCSPDRQTPGSSTCSVSAWTREMIRTPSPSYVTSSTWPRSIRWQLSMRARVIERFIRCDHRIATPRHGARGTGRGLDAQLLRPHARLLGSTLALCFELAKPARDRVAAAVRDLARTRHELAHARREARTSRQHAAERDAKCQPQRRRDALRVAERRPLLDRVARRQLRLVLEDARLEHEDTGVPAARDRTRYGSANCATVISLYGTPSSRAQSRTVEPVPPACRNAIAATV